MVSSERADIISGLSVKNHDEIIATDHL
jgi:hypothetical protein